MWFNCIFDADWKFLIYTNSLQVFAEIAFLCVKFQKWLYISPIIINRMPVRQRLKHRFWLKIFWIGIQWKRATKSVLKITTIILLVIVLEIIVAVNIKWMLKVIKIPEIIMKSSRTMMNIANYYKTNGMLCSQDVVYIWIWIHRRHVFVFWNSSKSWRKNIFQSFSCRNFLDFFYHEIIQIQRAYTTATTSKFTTISTNAKSECYLFRAVFWSRILTNGFGSISNAVVFDVQKCWSILSISRLILQ